MGGGCTALTSDPDASSGSGAAASIDGAGGSGATDIANAGGTGSASGGSSASSGGAPATDDEIPVTGDNTTVDFESGGIPIQGDPIVYDAFKEYGTSELAVLRAHPAWAAIQRARVHSFAYAGHPTLDLPSGRLTRDILTPDLQLPPNVRRIIEVFDEDDWEYLTPVRDARFSYRDLLTAAAKWPRFCAEKRADAPQLAGASVADVCALELASVFTHFAQEVGAHAPGGGAAPQPPGGTLANPGATMPSEQWRQGLFYIEELGYGGTTNVGYRQCDGDWGKAFPCADGASYHGRGAKQLSYNYNYGPFSRAAFGVEAMEVLLQAPERIADEGWLALSSAFYFHMTPRTPKPSIHETTTGLWLPDAADISANRLSGFGVSILIINGGVECGGASENELAANRRAYFQGIASKLGVWTGLAANFAKNDCVSMQAFNDGSDYQYPPSWVEDWTGGIGLADWEEGPFSPLFPGDYYRAKQASAASSHWDWRAGLGAPSD